MSGWRTTVFLAALVCLPAARAGERDKAEASSIRFEEIGAAAGLNARHETRNFEGEHADVLEMFTSGGAAVVVGDFDRDGDDDLFVTNSDAASKNRLYRNDGDFSFTEIAAEAGVAAGNTEDSIVVDALWFDFDNDGWEDLLVLRFGTPLLFANQRGSRFQDVTKSSGLDRFANSIAVVATDYDRDGDLDLVFGNYFQPVNLFAPPHTRVLPNNLDAATNGGGLILWRNLGGGRFEDATEDAGLGGYAGWVLDVGAGDLNNDGYVDLYAAADYGSDRIFFGAPDGRFRDVTEQATGFDTRKGMNAELGDYNNDGKLDIYVTNITDEYMRECNMLWHNLGDGTFIDVSKETGACDTRWGWSAKFADFDNDGWLDIFAANGMRSGNEDNYILAVLPVITRQGVDFAELDSWPDIGEMSWSGYQRSKLLWNRGGSSFDEISKAAGVDNDSDGRGVAIADLDNDGKLDLIQTNAGQPLLLYRRVGESAGGWLQLLLRARTGPPQAIGARVTVRGGGLTQVREVEADNGYAAQSMRRLHFGLGAAEEVEDLVVDWPSGRRERFAASPNQLRTLAEGEGEALEKVLAAR